MIARQASILLATVLLPACFCLAQEIEFTGIQIGRLEWVSSATTGVHTVQWSSDLSGEWYSSWQNIEHLQPTGTGTNSLAIPAFYRIVHTDIHHDISGDWSVDQHPDAMGGRTFTFETNGVVRTYAPVAPPYQIGTGTYVVIGNTLSAVIQMEYGATHKISGICNPTISADAPLRTNSISIIWTTKETDGSIQTTEQRLWQ